MLLLVSVIFCPFPSRIHRLILDFITPCFWVMMLYSPSMRKWIGSQIAWSKEDRAHWQCSIADLMYLTLVVALSTIASLFILSRPELFQRRALKMKSELNSEWVAIPERTDASRTEPFIDIDR